MPETKQEKTALVMNRIEMLMKKMAMIVYPAGSSMGRLPVDEPAKHGSASRRRGD